MDLKIPNSEHTKIRTAAGVQAEIVKIARRFAREASALAGVRDGYGTDITVGTDRARAHVWPKSAAFRAEIKYSPLMQVVGNDGGGGFGQTEGGQR